MEEFPSIPTIPPPARRHSEGSGHGMVKKGKRWYLDHCFCSKKKSVWGYSILGILLALVLVGLMFYARALREVRAWSLLKMNLKRDTKVMSRHASDLLTRHPIPHSQHPHSSPDPATLQVMRWTETQRPPVDHRGGFFFLIDQKGEILAHSGAKHLGWIARTSRQPASNSFPVTTSTPLVSSVYNLDAISQRSTLPLREILTVAQRGGGFVYFRWRHEQNYLAYVFPIFGTELIMGGAIPVPQDLLRSLSIEGGDDAASAMDASSPRSRSRNRSANSNSNSNSNSPFSPEERVKLHGAAFGPAWLMREGMISRIENSPAAQFPDPVESVSHLPLV